MRIVAAAMLACFAASPAAAQTFVDRFEATVAKVVSAISGHRQHGVASVYNEGTKTACGKPLDPRALTAAHRTLPCGTMVRVTRGDRSVVVKITDRGPFVPGRIIDLTPAAARALGFSGLATVDLDPL